MKIKLNTLLFFLIATAATALAQTTIPDGSNIQGSFTNAEAPYLIEGEAIIAANDTLIIEAGTEIQLTASTASTDTEYTYASLAVGMIRVYGTLIVNGTSELPVAFTRLGVDGKWGVILFDETSTDACKIDHAIIEHAGIVRTVIGNNDFPGAVSFYKCNGTLSNSTLRNNGKNFGSYTLGCGVVSYNATPLITKNIITQSLEYGIWCISDYGQETSPKIINNLITNNKEGIDLVFSNPIITNNTIANNTNYGINMMLAIPTMTNTILFGNGSSVNSSATGNMSYCLIEESSISGDISDNGGNILGEDPNFESGTSFNLSEASPCINAGTIDTTGLLIPQTDINNMPRITNDTIDIGAFEFAGDNTQVIQAATQNKLTIYPNPAKDYFQVNGIENENYKVEILTLTGKLLKTKKTINNEPIRTEELKNGLYLIKIKIDKSKTTIKLCINK